MIGACACAVLAAANLLQNPSFEDWPDGAMLPPHWSTYSPKSAPDVIAKVQALGTDGENCISFRNGGMGNFIYQKIKIKPGHYYNVSCDAKTDVGMYGFYLMPYWEDARGRRLPDANSGSGDRLMTVKTPWSPRTVRNFLAPTNAAVLVMNFGPNDCWSHNGVPGMIWVDNACVTESASVIDDAPVTVRPTDALAVLGADLSPTYGEAGVLVRGGRVGSMSRPQTPHRGVPTSDTPEFGKSEPVSATLVVEEPIGGGKAVLGARKEFSICPGEEKSVFTPVETSSGKLRLSVWVGDSCVWRKQFTGNETFLKIGINDPANVRKGEVFVPNDARWYTGFPIKNNIKAQKSNPNRMFGNPAELKARMFFEVPAGVEITSVKYSDWGGDLPVRKVLSAEPIEKNGAKLTRYELPVRISDVNRPLVFFRSSLPTGTKARGYAYMTWQGGAQVPREFTFTTVSYGRLEPFRRMQMRMDDLTVNLAKAICDDPVNELASYGVNSIAVPLMTTEKSDRAKFDFVRRAQASGRTWYFFIPNQCGIASWANDIKYRGVNVANLRADPDAAFTGRDGKPEKNVFGQVPPCPSYRGTNFLATARFFLDSPAVKDLGVTWLVCDFECWGPRPCYCDRCRKIFRESWCAANGHPDYGDPRAFMADEKAHPEAGKAWRAFYCWMRGQFYADFRKQLDKGIDPKRTTWWSQIPGRFSMSEWTAPNAGLATGVDVFDWPFGYKTPESVQSSVEGIFTRELKGVTGQYTCSVCPMQGCELCMHYPVISTYYNILEAATLGVRGFEFYYAPICESTTWKYVMDGLREIRPYEDLILDGKVTVRGEGENCTWRKIEKDGEALYLVRNYLLKEPTTVRFTDAGRTFTADLDPDHLAKLIYVR